MAARFSLGCRQPAGGLQPHSGPQIVALKRPREEASLREERTRNLVLSIWDRAGNSTSRMAQNMQITVRNMGHVSYVPSSARQAAAFALIQAHAACMHALMLATSS